MPNTFQDLLEELFAPLGGVSFRRMFGGVGIFKEGTMFALVSDDVLHLKADETTSPAYTAEGSSPWTYEGMRGKATAMPYWRLPERLLDEPEEFREWAEAAFAVAERTRKKPAAKEPTKPTPKKPVAKKPPPKKATAKKAAVKKPATRNALAKKPAKPKR